MLSMVCLKNGTGTAILQAQANILTLFWYLRPEHEL